MNGGRDARGENRGDEDKDENIADGPQQKQSDREGDDDSTLLRKEVELAVAALFPRIEGHDESILSSGTS
jgi:hypothetical protein